MSCEKRFQSELRQRGLRITPQRTAILSALHGFGAPVTVEEVYREAIGRNPAIRLSTVYRTLDLLKSIGLVSAVDLEGKQHRFLHVGQEEPHFHLRCRSCGKVTGVALTDLGGLVSRLRSKHGFTLEPAQVILPGICRKCR